VIFGTICDCYEENKFSSNSPTYLEVGDVLFWSKFTIILMERLMYPTMVSILMLKVYKDQKDENYEVIPPRMIILLKNKRI